MSKRQRPEKMVQKRAHPEKDVSENTAANTQKRVRAEKESNEVTTAKTKKPKAIKQSTDMDTSDSNDESKDNETLKRPALSASSPFLALFWSLADAKAVTRQTSVTELVQLLKNEQSNHKITKVAGNLFPHLTPNLSYALKRLLRGICSSSEFARLGFTAALTEVLSEFSTVIQFEDIKKIQLTSQQTPESPSRSETTNFKIGHCIFITVLSLTNWIPKCESEWLESQVKTILPHFKTRSISFYATEAIVGVIKFSDISLLNDQLAPIFLSLCITNPEVDAEEDSSKKSIVDLESISVDLLAILLAMMQRRESDNLELNLELFPSSLRHPLNSDFLPSF